VHVGRGRTGRGVVGPRGQEGDHVVVGHRLDSATAAGVGGGAERTGSTLSAGTVPARACAARTSTSTRHHSSYLWARSRPPISASVYRSIMGLRIGRARPTTRAAATIAYPRRFPRRRKSGGTRAVLAAQPGTYPRVPVQLPGAVGRGRGRRISGGAETAAGYAIVAAALVVGRRPADTVDP